MTATVTANWRLTTQAWARQPPKKDLFVEMDYMPGLLASEEESTASPKFANMPIRNPTEPPYQPFT